MFHVPSSTVAELIRATILDEDGVVAWSLWDGYLKMRSGLALRERLKRNDVDMVRVHTSGHASVADLQPLVTAQTSTSPVPSSAPLDATKVVAIHTEAADRFADLFRGVEAHTEGEWRAVRN